MNHAIDFFLIFVILFFLSFPPCVADNWLGRLIVVRLMVSFAQQWQQQQYSRSNNNTRMNEMITLKARILPTNPPRQTEATMMMMMMLARKKNHYEICSVMPS